MVSGERRLAAALLQVRRARAGCVVALWWLEAVWWLNRWVEAWK